MKPDYLVTVETGWLKQPRNTTKIQYMISGWNGQNVLNLQVQISHLPVSNMELNKI